MIFVNFKVYEEGSGEHALKLSYAIQEASLETSVPMIPVVQAVDLQSIVKAVTIPVWVQSIDPVDYGPSTGSFPASEAKALGAQGVFLNHSEKKLTKEVLHASVTHAKDAGLEVLIFAADTAELSDVLALKPDYVSYEPPDLVGSTTTSVSEGRADVIDEAVRLCHEANIPLIVGAGIRTRADVSVAFHKGAKGVAVAKSVVTSNEPKNMLVELAHGFI